MQRARGAAEQVSCSAGSAQPLPHLVLQTWLQWLQCWEHPAPAPSRVAGVAAVPRLCHSVADRNRRCLPWCSEPCELSGLLNNLTFMAFPVLFSCLGSGEGWTGCRAVLQSCSGTPCTTPGCSKYSVLCVTVPSRGTQKLSDSSSGHAEIVTLRLCTE